MWSIEFLHTTGAWVRVAVTLPAVLAESQIVKVLAHMLQLAQNALSSQSENLGRLMQRSWPEWVILPNHPLAWFDEESEAPLLDLDPL